MSYQVLARRWRPQTFDQVVGQEPVTRTLRNALRGRRLAHALLFAGPRGVGKTTTARLVAKALNCEKSPGPDPCNACPACQEIALGTSVDCIEIDAATHTGVDHVRGLQEQLAYHPIRGKSKVYIVDEVHMLSAGAFNALLKTLEEPPPSVLFILATTEPHKVPATIHSRCQRHDFRKIGPDQIRERLAEIALAEGVRLDEDALALLARGADGSLRDGQSLLDQAIAYCGAEIGGQAVAELLGLVASDALFAAAGAVAEGAAGRLLELVEELSSRGSDLRLFAGELLGHLRNLLVVKVTAKARQFLGLAPADFERTAAQAEAFTVPRLEVLLHLLAQAEAEMRRSGYPRFILEVALVRMAETAAVAALDDLIRRLTELEGRLGGGGLTAPAPAPQPTLFREVASAPARPGPPGSSLQASPSPAARPAPPPGPGPLPPPSRPPRKEGAPQETARAPESGSPGPPAARGLAGSAPAGPDLAAAWVEVKRRLERQKRLVTLLEEVQEVRIEGETLVLIFPNGNHFSRMTLEAPENRQLVSAAAAEAFGQRLAVEYRFLPAPPRPATPEGPAPSDRVPEPEVPHPAAPADPTGHPLVQEALRLFGGRPLPPDRRGGAVPF